MTVNRSLNTRADVSWRQARQNLARALALLQSRQVLLEGSGASLGSAIDQSLQRLDSEQGDEVGSLGGERDPVYLDITPGVGLGELQRIQRLRDILLGEDGLIATLRELEAPRLPE